MAAERIILGVDPGSRCMGYGLVRERSGVLSLVEAGVVRPSEEAMSARLGLMFARISELLHAHSPHAVAVENVFFARNSASALKLGQARGAVLAACGVHGAQVFGYEPKPQFTVQDEGAISRPPAVDFNRPQGATK